MKNIARKISTLLRSAGLIFFLSGEILTAQSPQVVDKNDAIERIRTAYEEGLPLAASWNTGSLSYVLGFDPVWQTKTMIEEEGQLIQPAFTLGLGGYFTDWKTISFYFEDAMRFCAEHKLPIAFIVSQIEGPIVSENWCSQLPADQNPCVLSSTCSCFVPLLDPLGAMQPWYDIGYRAAHQNTLQKLQEIYPDPPFILFVSNNEAPKIDWYELEKSQRYLDQYGMGRGLDFMAQTADRGWNERYKKMIEGFKNGLTNLTWKSNSRFIGYAVFNNYFGMDILAHSEISNKYLFDSYPVEAWDGVSPHSYVGVQSRVRDYIVHSPQFEAGNIAFAVREARKVKPNFYLESSIWDGGKEEWLVYEREGQTYSPERYLGMVQNILWSLHPQIMREYRHYTDSRLTYEPYYRMVLTAIARVHKLPILRRFWLEGSIVPDKAIPSPFNYKVPPEFLNEDRFYQLQVDVNNTSQWHDVRAEVKVFALAYVVGNPPNREWLLYAHAPRGSIDRVGITIPEFGEVKVPVALGGSFYLISEGDRKVTSVSLSPVINPIGNREVSIGEFVEFTITITGGSGPITFSSSGLPPGATLDPQIGKFHWIPLNQDVGTHEIIFYVSDGQMEDSQAVIITVSGEPGNEGFLKFKNLFNPIKETVQIPFNLRASQNVVITVFDRKGQKVRELLNGQKQAGTDFIEWDGRNDSQQIVASGTYIVVINFGKISQKRKLVILK